MITGYTERKENRLNDIFLLLTDTAGDVIDGYPQYIGLDRDDGVVGNQIFVRMLIVKDNNMLRCILTGSTTSLWKGYQGGIDFSIHTRTIFSN